MTRHPTVAALPCLVCASALWPAGALIAAETIATASSAASVGHPVLRPVPVAVRGVAQPVLSLSGHWQLALDPPAAFWSSATDPAAWEDVTLPQDLRMRDARPVRGREYALRRTVSVPADFAGKRTILRFESVTGRARVWIDGKHVRDHDGGFVAWESDITDFVTPGRAATITLGVTDPVHSISDFESGGVLRDVRLFAAPSNHVVRFHAETSFDREYRDAVLRVTAGAAFHTARSARLDLVLTDDRGRAVRLPRNSINLPAGSTGATIDIPVSAPTKWDAEHPALYTLEGHLMVGGQRVQTVRRQIGFRQIERRGRIMLVNGQEVKLRGINHHDVAPAGRSVTPAMDEQDVRLFRDANINFIRTSHYPPSEAFLDAADRLGMYISDSASIAFVDKATASDPARIGQLVDAAADMIERDRSHPSVFAWDLANESSWGSGMAAVVDYAKRADPSRPTVWSFGDRAPGGTDAPYDLYSLHYASYSRDLSAGGPHGPGDKELSGASAWQHIAQPVLHDEWAHVATYDLDELRRDPNIRNFYGESIARFWRNLFPANGALGGAIWAGLDEAPTPDRPLPPEWGIIDIRRRPKPEWWLVKKAYSPVRLDTSPLTVPHGDGQLRVRVRNWFDHTNLKELRVDWRAGGAQGTFSGPDIAPHSDGTIDLPARAWRSGDIVNLRFLRADGQSIDEYDLQVEPPSLPPISGSPGPPPRVTRTKDEIVVTGTHFQLAFSKRTGLITRGAYKGTTIVESGPFLHLDAGTPLPEWNPDGITARIEGNVALVRISGAYGQTKVRFELKVDRTGGVETRYTLDAVPPLLRRLVRGHSFSRDVGGYFEVGVSFLLSPDIDRLSWHRKGQWSAYPDDHIGRTRGVAPRDPSRGESLSWAQDDRSPLLWGRYDLGGRGTNDFRSMKTDIYRAAAIVRGSDARLEALSPGTDAVRLAVVDDPDTVVNAGDPRLALTGSWVRDRTRASSATAGDAAELEFEGRSITWIGPKDADGGIADVYIDGKLEAAGIDLFTPRPAADKLPNDTSREILFAREGLATGRHRIRIVVRPAGKDGAGRVSVTALRIGRKDSRGQVRMIVNNSWNYPQLSWGNYVKDPITVTNAQTNIVRVRFTDHDTQVLRP